MQKNKRIGWIDIARGVGVLSIIFSHTGYLPLSAYLTPVIHTFMIPVFLFIGGYLFQPGANFLSFAKNKINKLLGAYVIFFLISSIIWFFIRSGYSSSILDIPYQTLLTGFVLGKGTMINGPLWFLTAYFSSLILVRSIYYWGEKRNRVNKLLLAFFFILLFLILKKETIFTPFSYDLVLLFSGYLLLGRLLYIYRKRLFTARFLLLTIIIFILGVFRNGETNIYSRVIHNPVLFIINSLSGSFLVLYFSQTLEKIFNKYLKFIKYTGRNSLVFFSIHWPAMQLSTFLLGLTGIINQTNSVATSTNFFFPTVGPSSQVTLIRLSLFISYTLVSLFSGWVVILFMNYKRG
ncbi:hypothetical protein A3D03_04775 [Candidatus Gottesmanbacteria bacterium RIFCSPHIGHO2_02_FULL_40_13]|uniref:Acyltransferase 3 domain-containing protein n=1 Tax=Candidatus Gottesmanbacteria bacterium RIFCSPHIGHO2_02_FULL_40_13 TaxID=1798384 RepID=A0A1F6A9C7_9BACT|nr:MAG: hypothetical protein A3D03_04775 [Candidatus Gottesmanbacteria bacterium RIFCSPHIGHO2_02_FULL_40_13]